MKNLFLFILVALSLQCYSQSEVNLKIDSLIQSLKSLPDDTSKVNKLIVIGKLQLTVNPNSALEYALQAKEIATKINYPLGVGEALYLEGRVYTIQGDYTNGMLKYENALDIFEANPFEKGIVKALMAIGKSYTLQGNFLAALKYKSLGLEIARNIGDQLVMTWRFLYGCRGNWLKKY